MQWARPGTQRLSALLIAIAIAACDGASSSPDGALPPARVTPRFELAGDPIDFGAIPYPDDLYLDERGRVAIGELPGEAQALPSSFPDAMRAGLTDLDGFSALAPVFFYFPPDSLDAGSLPEIPTDTMREDSAVFVLDVDPASPAAFRRVPVAVHYHAELGQLALRPADGHPLVAGRRYAAIVTTDVRDDRGEPIGPDARFASIRDAQARPSDPLYAEAWDHYAPVLASMASNGIARERVAGLAVFTVQRVEADLRDARTSVWSGEVPEVWIDRAIEASELDALLGTPEIDAPGTDVPGGVAHSHIGWVIHGRFSSPSFLSGERGVHGRFARGEDGALIVQRTDEVPFTLTLPTGDVSRLRVVIFQHDVGAERSEMFAIADALAAASYAVFAIDLPFHGMRALGEELDVSHRFGPGEGPDGFGDRTGAEVQLEFLGAADDRGELPPFHPSSVRDAFRQSVVDLMAGVRALRTSDWQAALGTRGIEQISLAAEPIGFVGVSLGGIIGTIFTATEPEIGAAILDVTGGDLTRLIEGSATFAGSLFPVLFPKIGVELATYDPTSYPASFHPEVALYQTVLDRGDAMVFAPLLSELPIDLLFQSARYDEVVPDRSTEALVRAAGGEIVGDDPAHTDLARGEPPITGNVEAPDRRVTRGLVRFAPATHALLSRRTDEQRFEHPPAPPFEPIAPRNVENPVDAAVVQVVHFFESWRSGAAEIADPSP